MRFSMKTADRCLRGVLKPIFELIARLLCGPSKETSEEQSETVLARMAVDESYREGLPLIPADSRVENHSLLRRIDIAVTITRNGSPMLGAQVTALSNVASDSITQPKTTNSRGETSFRVESRVSGVHEFILTEPYAEFEHSPLWVDFDRAWYENAFYVTAYNVCHEDDFRGERVDAHGLTERHKDDFLFSGKGVCMQGSGQASGGQYIRIINPRDLTWENGFRRITKPEDAVFGYGLGGAFRPVEEGVSIAVDPKVIPTGHWVSIERVGVRRADDTGGAIDDYHVDVFMGGGERAIANWTVQGGNMMGARVKYLGRKLSGRVS
jgi:hypothetical protein